MPFADVNTLKVPEDLRDEQLLLLSDVIPTGWHGNELSRVQEGGKVAVWGAGPVGSMAAYLAKNIRNASHVANIDHNPARLARSQANGCDTLNFDEVDVVKELRHRMAPGPEHAIDCVGVGAVRLAPFTCHVRAAALSPADFASPLLRHDCVHSIASPRRSCRGWS